MPYTIQIIEDETDFSQPLTEVLEATGYATRVAVSIAAYKAEADIAKIDLLILDRTLPDGDGLSLLPEIRQRSNLPVIVLTGMSAIHERVHGMNADADHYLVKPVDIDELLAIIQRHKRKKSRDVPGRTGAWKLDARAWVLTSPSGMAASLTQREARLIGVFAGIPGEPVHRDQLVAAMGFAPGAYDFRRLETMMSRLRKKLSESGLEEFPLVTIYGGGYALHADLVTQFSVADVS
jgi:DNA-binding response OmpR family regulator